MNERIKLLRKDLLNLTMEKFGEAIGVSKSAVNQLEKGINNPSEQTISLICREFNVNETWLRDGIGDPFISRSRNEEISDFVQRIQVNDEVFKIKLISMLAQMNENEWEILENMAKRLAAEDTETVAAAPDHDLTVAELEEEYKKSRSGIARSEALSASNTKDAGADKDVG